MAKVVVEEYKSEEGERELKRTKMDEIKPQLEVDPTAAERISPNVVKNKVLNPDRATMEGAGTVEDISQVCLKNHDTLSMCLFFHSPCPLLIS